MSKVGSREDEMIELSGSSAFPKRFLSAFSLRRAAPSVSLWFQPFLAALALTNLGQDKMPWAEVSEFLATNRIYSR